MMKDSKFQHPLGEENTPFSEAKNDLLATETFGGNIHVEWDPTAAVTPIGQLPFFIQFLKVGGLFEPWISSCPLQYQSNNAPKKVDVLGSFLLSILSGHNRYAHMASLMGDVVNTQMLGMSKVVSDDSARRALKKMDEDEGVDWLQNHLQRSYEPLLTQPWILDSDVTVKPLYGHQEGAVVGYNPHKPGRPSHTYHTYMIANLRLVLEVEVKPGTDTAASHSSPGLWELLDRLPSSSWPKFIRGDCDWGVDDVMTTAEEKQLNYLFKLRKSKHVKQLIHKHHSLGGWSYVIDGWEAKDDYLRLSTWRNDRRVVIVRRRLSKDAMLALEDKQEGQQAFGFLTEAEDIRAFEYAVLVTSLDDEVISIVRHYRDRADCENNFDEIKNHWGWGGFTTTDIKPCRLIARIIALVYNGWNIFARLANPDKHMEAITSRPLLLSSVGRLTETGRKKTMTITSTHAQADYIQDTFQRIQAFFTHLKTNAPQLTRFECWCLILSEAMKKYLGDSLLKPPDDDYLSV
ncbi:MAG: transposase [Pseudomonadales bacterium]